VEELNTALLFKVGIHLSWEIYQYFQSLTTREQAFVEKWSWKVSTCSPIYWWWCL